MPKPAARARALLPALVDLPVGLASCGEQSTPAASIGSAERTVLLAEGRSLYMAHCMMCHQAQGEGVPGMQPPLVGVASVTGDPGRLIELTLRGIGRERGQLPPTGPWRQEMLGFDHLSDREIAAVLTYIRQSWGNNAPAISQEQVFDARQGR